jgi:hypothetical protein
MSLPDAETEKKANDYAIDALKQVLTLASAILALTITFMKDILGDSRLLTVWRALIPCAWISMIVTIWTAWVATAHAARVLGTGAQRGYVFGQGKARVLARVAQWSFAIGLTMLGIFAVRNYQLFFHK